MGIPIVGNIISWIANKLISELIDRGVIEFKDVMKNYRLGETTVPALRGVNFTLQPGEFTTLIGASGSGI